MLGTQWSPARRLSAGAGRSKQNTEELQSYFSFDLFCVKMVSDANYCFEFFVHVLQPNNFCIFGLFKQILYQNTQPIQDPDATTFGFGKFLTSIFLLKYMETFKILSKKWLYISSTLYATFSI